MINKGLSIWVGDLQIQDLRCHQQCSWTLDSGINIFIGENGCGKTSVLEAVYLMAYGRSFRQARDPELVRWQSSQFSIRGTWHRYGPLHVQVRGRRRKTEILLQGRKLTKKKELAETLPVLVDAPQARKIIDGVSNERRKWLDQLLMLCEPTVRQHYQAYLRALMQRSRVLRKYGDGNELSAWEEQMVLHGRHIKQQRDKICALFNLYLAKEVLLTESVLEMEIASQIPDNNDDWLKLLQQKREQDRRMGRCTSGPHSDKLKINFSGREIRAVGSRGQQKLAAIAMKLAECALVEQYRHIWPILLLDDCFEALDEKRRLHVIQRLCDYPGQVLVTAPNNVDAALQLPVKVWQMHAANTEKKIDGMVLHDIMEKTA